MAIRIITDSASDILPKEAEKLNIKVLPLKTYFGEEEYLDGVTITNAEFFQFPLNCRPARRRAGRIFSKAG